MCRQTEDARDLGFSYFPIEKGKYWIYQVDSIVYDDYANRIDTFNYQQKLFLDTTFDDQSGDECYRLIHYYRYDTISPWKYQKTSCIQRDNQIAQQIIHDKRIVKLNFPIYQYNNWDINAFNTSDEQIAYVTEAGFEHSINGKSYNDCINIELADEVDLIFTWYDEEVYARNIGLIEKNYTFIETQNEKRSGSSYHKILIETNWTE